MAEVGTHPEAGDDDEHPVRSGWPAWILVVACALPPVLLAEAARRVFGGSYDLEYFGGYSGGYLSDGTLESAATRNELSSRLQISVTERFAVLWEQVSLPTPLLGPVLAGVLLAAVVLAGRPAALVPGRWAARVAAGALALSALEALAVTLGVLQGISEPADSDGSVLTFWTSRPPEDLVEFTGAAAVLVPAVVVPAVAGFVVWRERPVVAAEPAPPVEAPVEPSGAPAAETPAPEPPEAQEPAMPVVSEAQRELYRRR